MNENRWSPFDPEWYQAAFDKFIATADSLFNTDLIIEQGYHIPDHDGSRSSVFRNNAVLNNSFNEKQLRETLKDIYLNSSHKLVASNHDNTHFHQWVGHMSDLNINELTHTAELVIPMETFIYPAERDKYKLSQFYRKWIKIEDILNNWDIFKWHCLMFIDQKVFSEYELRIDDHQVTVKFQYYDYWVKANHPVYIYKFDTNGSCRVKISRYLCNEVWKWKMPMSYLEEQGVDLKVLNNQNVVVAFNKIREGRDDGLTAIEIVGDNLEFMTIEDGYLDLSKISQFNNVYIQSEATEWLWMSIFVPKFFHEYPILLPVDSVFRPYLANFEPVVTIKNNVIHHVKTQIGDEYKQVYVDLNGKLKDEYDGWKQMIRPVVLADAFDQCEEPYESLILDIDRLRDLTVKGADIVEKFRFFLYEYTNEREDEFNQHLRDIRNSMASIMECYHEFLDNLQIEYDKTYEFQYKKFQLIMTAVQAEGFYSEYLTNYKQTHEDSEDDFFFMISPLIYIPRELADRYYIINIIKDLTEHDKHLWDNVSNNEGIIRFQRPIDETDFWTFEYIPEKEVWRPYPLKMTRHFPDVYIPEDPEQETPELNRLFKAFFFYSDTMNVVEESNDIVRATPAWNDDVKEYHFDQGANYRDIFMEKFYWMGVRTIYKGLLSTHNRWEAIEYIIDNSSYERFNQLFLQTMDPYFKLGLATYLKSDNYEFPFDDAIAKLEESITSNWLDHKRITNFEIYLNKTWIPSYFDYITKIMDNFDWSNRLLRRPRSTFDTTRIIPILRELQQLIIDQMNELKDIVDWIIEKLSKEDYNLNVDNFHVLKDLINVIYENIASTLEYMDEIDLEIFSINDVNFIIDKLREHIRLINVLNNQFSVIYNNTEAHNVYEPKRELLNRLRAQAELLPERIAEISAIIQDFNMQGFMDDVNDLRTMFIYNKVNPDDNSLMYKVNEFNDPWSKNVQEYRDRLFQSTSVLYGTFKPDKSYTKEEVVEFVSTIDRVKLDISDLTKSIKDFYDHFGYEVDQDIINRLENAMDRLNDFRIKIGEYMAAREKFLLVYNTMIELLQQFDQFNIGKTEQKLRGDILEELENMLTALSYIAGVNNKDDAMTSMIEINTYLEVWKDFIDVEEEVFLKIFELSKPPIRFITTLEENKEIIEALIEYMDTVNNEFIPDKSWPTYSDIYEIDEIEMISGGFNHKVGETVHFFNLGSYKITEVEGNVSKAKAIEDLDYRKTTFRDPLCQSNPYDSITNGEGLGISVRALSSKHTRIINDKIIDQIILKIKNGVYLITRDTETYNPRNDSQFRVDIDFIRNIKTSWDEIVDIYWDYMTDDARLYTDELVSLIQTAIDPCEKFIETRSNIRVNSILATFEEYIVSSYKYAEASGNLNEYYCYCDNLLRNSYNALFDFYGNGSGWTDGQELRKIINVIEYPINFFKSKILDTFEKNEFVDHIIEIHYNLIQKLSDVRSNISHLTEILVDIDPVVRQVNSRLEEVPKLQKDVWYRLKFTKVALEGKGYKVGDIVELVPQLPTDAEGKEIHGMDDIILNDKILLQVKTVEDGGVVTDVQPLLNYALPYLIWGPREVVTVTGEGEGLLVDIYSYEIDITDSTLFKDAKSDISTLPQFDENDMFMFKFENIHDLDVNYEVFLGGKQITNFFQRHETTENPLHPMNIDVLYMNANEVMDLANSSIYIAAENYFIYKIDGIEIKDPGAGYCVGQDIFVDLDLMALRVKISKLVNGPYKGIAEVEVDGIVTTTAGDPTTKNAEVVTDSLNNIDDEYNVGYYDKLTQQGINKDVTFSIEGGIRVDLDSMGEITENEVKDTWESGELPVDGRNKNSKYLKDLTKPETNQIYIGNLPKDLYGDFINFVEMTSKEIEDLYYLGIHPNEEEYAQILAKGEYVFTAKRFDNMESDDRNSTYMYPDVDMPLIEDIPENGDPDYHWYQGSRIDNSQHPMEDSRLWNGIQNVVPPTDPFIPDDRRIPTGQPPKGEYQRVLKERLHRSRGASINLDLLSEITQPEAKKMWFDDIIPEDGEELIKELREITESEVSDIYSKNIPEDSDIDIANFTEITVEEVKNLWYYNIIPNESDEGIEYGLRNAAMIRGDLSVLHYIDLPKHTGDFPQGKVNSTVIVESDETHGGHRMLYRIRTFIAAGFFVYDLPEVADYKWNTINVNWMDCDFYPDHPSLKALYPSEDWHTAESFRKIQQNITDGKISPRFENIKYNHSTYIHNLTLDDIAVFNWTTKKWEDLHDTSRWIFNVRNNDEKEDWGFSLTLIEDDLYSYDMRLYLNKTPVTQMRNAQLKRNAKMDITAVIQSEVSTKAINTSVNTGRHLRIRKLFPYEQKESYKIGYNEDGTFIGYEMDFKMANYLHFKNEIHLEDIKIFNRSANRFEDILDRSMYEVRFKDPKAVSRGYETQTRITQTLIGNAGIGFVDGEAWAWNAEFGIHLFGRVTADYEKDGHLITFEAVHCPNPPEETISLEFNVFQHASQSEVEMATILVDFTVERLEVFGDGYIHNVSNRLAPVPREFKVIPQYDLDGPGEYDIIISKTPKSWTFIEPNWLMSPTFHLDGYNVSRDRLYVLTDKGRFPLVNPSTGKPTLRVVEKGDGTDVTFLNLYRRYEHLQIRSTPYPMRSVYVQRRIPSHGFIDLGGKINKPLNKKYFEFWVNGKLLFDEVTIISPTKIFLHGLTSLKNLEIIEVNRDSNEFFSDKFLEISQTALGRPYVEWNYQTYLDDVLEGNIDGDNYTKEEQATLLTPVWPQVDESHPEFKNYPPNVDVDEDVLLRTNPEDYPLNDLEDPTYQFLVINQPTLEGKPIVEQTLTFRHFGFTPISDDMIIDMLNEEWAEEIKNNPHLGEHSVLNDDEWYGTTARLYDEYGVLVHTLDESVYHVADPNLLKINSSTKVSRIVKNNVTYDLT